MEAGVLRGIDPTFVADFKARVETEDMCPRYRTSFKKALRAQEKLALKARVLRASAGSSAPSKRPQPKANLRRPTPKASSTGLKKKGQYEDFVDGATWRGMSALERNAVLEARK